MDNDTHAVSAGRWAGCLYTELRGSGVVMDSRIRWWLWLHRSGCLPEGLDT